MAPVKQPLLLIFVYARTCMLAGEDAARLLRMHHQRALCLPAAIVTFIHNDGVHACAQEELTSACEIHPREENGRHK